MLSHRLLASLLLPFGLVFTALPATARPEIASGDQLLDTNPQGCLDRADSLISELDIESAAGDIDRTGYFEDGTFRILCYGAGEQSMAIIFASHNDSLEVATSFVRMALDRLSQATANSPPATITEVAAASKR